jgi:hypothetical protein
MSAPQKALLIEVVQIATGRHLGNLEHLTDLRDGKLSLIQNYLNDPILATE